VKLLFLLFDWLFGYWIRLVHIRAKGQLLLFDRHFVDLLVDTKRYRYSAPMWLARLVAPLVPKPDIFIFLDLPAEVAHARKPEVALEEAGGLRERYLQMARSLDNARIVDASRPLEEVVIEVKRIIMDYMEARTHCRLLNRSEAVEVTAKSPCAADGLKWLENALNVRLTPVGGIMFGIVSLPGGRGYLIPLSNKKAAVQALSLYGAQNLKARVGKQILRTGLILSLTQLWLPRVELDGLDSDQENSLLRLLHNLFGRSDIEIAISLGTPGPQRKPVVQVLSRQGEVLGFAKVGWNGNTCVLVKNEADALNSLGNFRLQHSVLPQVLHFSKWNGRVLLVTSPLSIFAKADIPRVLTETHIQCLEELSQADLEYARFKESLFWRTIRERVKRQEGAVPSYQMYALKQAMALLEDRLGDETLPWVWRFGDFTPWNVQFDVRISKVHVIDLEYASRCWLPGWDLFHYLCSPHWLGRLKKVMARVYQSRESNWVREYTRRMSMSEWTVPLLHLGYVLDIYTMRFEMWHRSNLRLSPNAIRVFRYLSNCMEYLCIYATQGRT